ncbi:MAG TPA: diguanylate cyclase, partial [Spirochaetes bacterium]|nr:diguanylate cyclase [Spirochaetota bacterium]
MNSGAYDYLVKDKNYNYLTFLPITVENALKQKHIRARNNMLTSSITNISDSIYITEKNDIIIFVNRAFCNTYKYDENEILGKDSQILWNTESQRDGLVDSVDEYYHKRKNGREFPVSLTRSAIKDEKDRDVAYVSIVRDITKQKLNEERLRLAAVVFENTMEGLMITDTVGTILSINPAFSAISGYNKNEVMGQNSSILHSGRHDKAFFHKMWTTLIQTDKWSGEIWNRRKNGEIFPEWLSITAIKDNQGKVAQYAGVFNDITGRKQYEELIKYQAYHDALTALPNRELFNDRLNLAVTQGERDKSKMAILFLDLDDFKQVNDSFGHSVGDLLLQKAADIFIESVRKGDTVARFGGDEFAIILSRIDNQDNAAAVAQMIIDRFKNPVLIDQHKISVGVSIGISLFPDHGIGPDKLLEMADNAMYQVKEKGKNNFLVYNGV